MYIQVCLFAHSRFGLYFSFICYVFIRVFVFSQRRDISFVFIIIDNYYSSKVSLRFLMIFHNVMSLE